MTKPHTSNTHWDDFEFGIRIVCGAIAVGGALIVGPALSTAAVHIITSYAAEFYGEAPTLAAKATAIAATWGFVFGAIFGASGWLRYATMPKLRAKTDHLFSGHNSPSGLQK